MITTLIGILVLILIIGFMRGGFLAIVVTVIAILIGYFTGLYGVLAVVTIVTLVSGVYKYKLSKQ